MSAVQNAAAKLYLNVRFPLGGSYDASTSEFPVVLGSLGRVWNITPDKDEADKLYFSTVVGTGTYWLAQSAGEAVIRNVQSDATAFKKVVQYKKTRYGIFKDSPTVFLTVPTSATGDTEVTFDIDAGDDRNVWITS